MGKGWSWGALQAENTNLQGSTVERTLTAREGSSLEVERPHQHVGRYVNIWREILKILVFVPRTLIKILNDLLEVIQPVNKDMCKKYQHSKTESAYSQ